MSIDPPFGKIDQYMEELEKAFKEHFRKRIKIVAEKAKTFDEVFKKQPGSIEEAIDELMNLFYLSGEKDRKRIYDLYEDYLTRSYEAGAYSTEPEMPGWIAYFDTPDYDMLRAFKGQSSTIFTHLEHRIAGDIRSSMLKSFSHGRTRDQAIKDLMTSSLNLAYSKSQTIVYTELHRATMSGRVSQYNKNKNVKYLVWRARPLIPPMRCSRSPTCEKMHGTTYKKDEIPDVVPGGHPRCRCAWRPITQLKKEFNLVKNNIKSLGADQEQIDGIVEGVLALPDDMRQITMKDLNNEQLRLFAAGQSQTDQLRGVAASRNTAAYYFNSLEDDPRIGNIGLDPTKIRKGTDFIVLFKADMNITDCFFHEFAHYLDISVLPRYLHHKFPHRMNAHSFNTTEWIKAHGIMKRNNESWNRENALLNYSEFFAEAWQFALAKPVRSRNWFRKFDEEVKADPEKWKDMPELWPMMSNIIQFLKQALKL